MEKQIKRVLILFLKDIFFKIFIGLLIFCGIFLNPITLKSYEILSNENNLSNCKLMTNCSFQNWNVDDSEKAFTELIEILENTPRIKIIKKDSSYIHAIVTSRIMKFIDDVEIKKFDKYNILQIKSASRLGIYDLGVNKRRLETLRFRLIDIYD